MDLKDVKLPSGVKQLEAKGIKTMDKLVEVLNAGDQQASEINDLRKELDDLRAQREEQSLETGGVDDGTGAEDGGNGGAPQNQDWMLNQNQYEQQFQTDLMGGRGVQAVSGITRFWVDEAIKKNDAKWEQRWAKAEAKLREAETINSYAAQAEEATTLMGEDFVKKHEKDMLALLKKKGDQPLVKDEIVTMLMRKKLSEEADAKANVEAAEAVGAARGAQDFAEGAGDASSKGGVDLSKMTIEEMEEVLPHGDERKPIMEGE